MKVGDLVKAAYYGIGVVTQVDLAKQIVFVRFADTEHWLAGFLAEVISESR